MKRVEMKIGKMRKSDNCVVYPEHYLKARGDNLLFVQGKRLVMIVNTVTGDALANYRHKSTYPNTLHLMEHPMNDGNIEKMTLTLEQVEAIKNAVPKSGDKIGGGVYLA